MITLAVISSDSKGSEFYRNLVEYFTANGRKTDQQHVPTNLIHLPQNNKKEFEAKCLIAIQNGADFLVIAEKEKLNKNIELILKRLKELYNIAVSKLDENNSNKTQIMSDVFNTCQNSTPKLFSFNKRELKKEDLNKIKDFLKKLAEKQLVAGVIGGAGPLASAQFYQLLSHMHAYYIGLDDTLAPGKNESIMKHANKKSDPQYHFIPHYKNDIDLLRANNVRYLSIPCNTAHVCHEEFNHDNQPELKDIRESVIERVCRQNDNNINDVTQHIEKVAVFGTPATVQHKLYDDILKTNNIEFINPEETYIEEIYAIINRVKQDPNRDEAKKDFEKIVEDFRNKHGKDCWILLVCTELSVLFSKEECKNKKFISSNHALADSIKRAIHENSPKNQVIESHSLDNLRDMISKNPDWEFGKREPIISQTPELPFLYYSDINAKEIPILQLQPYNESFEESQKRKTHKRANSSMKPINNVEPKNDLPQSNQQNDYHVNAPVKNRRHSVHTFLSNFSQNLASCTFSKSNKSKNELTQISEKNKNESNVSSSKPKDTETFVKVKNSLKKTLSPTFLVKKRISEPTLPKLISSDPKSESVKKRRNSLTETSPSSPRNR